MKVTYFNHSGFLIETENKVLVFDYYSQGGRFDFFDPKNYVGKDIVFFVSHNHGDHFDTRIFQWAEQAAYVLSHDVKAESAFRGEILYVKAHETYHFHDMVIETLRSNDEGVAFAVEADGKTIYHAGDLNWWHWDGESKEFNDQIAQSYQEEIQRIKGRIFDVAFVPADLRLADKYCWATDYFMQEVGGAAVFPMHFWRRFDVCRMLKEKPYGDKIRNITEENQSFSL
ncbi:MAG: MBL fold metallo-hydrolase [Clostridia bacterium]|nr:MBL fold metallo-hydrolase [Clostridia bacterium]